MTNVAGTKTKADDENTIDPSGSGIYALAGGFWAGAAGKTSLYLPFIVR